MNPAPLTSSAALQGFLDAVPDALVVFDREGRIVLVNREAERLFEYSHEELVGRPVEAIVPDGLAVDAPSGRKRDGAEFPAEIKVSSLQSEQGPLVSAAIRDVSARRRLEDRLRTALKEKDVLLKEVHHRVKNDLQVVSSMLSMRMHSIEDPSALELLKETQSQVRSIALFHESLSQSTDLARVNLAEYLKRLVTGVFATYGVSEERVQLSFHVEAIPLEIDAAVSCGLVVNELVSNALKHGFPGGRRGTVELRLRADGPAHVVLEVNDDGSEFPRDVSPTAPTTLGLKLVKIFVEQLHGEIRVDRTEGTRIVIRFERGGRGA